MYSYAFMHYSAFFCIIIQSALMSKSAFDQNLYPTEKQSYRVYGLLTWSNRDADIDQNSDSDWYADSYCNWKFNGGADFEMFWSNVDFYR